jgi:hypothetical protein
VTENPRAVTVAAVPRRGPAAFVVERLRMSRVLQASAVLAFVEYGALAVLAVFGERLRKDMFTNGSNVPFAGWMALCSLGSWVFLFAWFPFLRTLLASDGGDGSAMRLGRVLEGVAITCVAAVHVLLAVNLVRTL